MTTEPLGHIGERIHIAEGNWLLQGEWIVPNDECRCRVCERARRVGPHGPIYAGPVEKVILKGKKRGMC